MGKGNKGSRELNPVLDRALARSGLGMLGANLVGALFVFTYLSYIAPAETLKGKTVGGWSGPLLFLAYFAVAGGTCWRYLHKAESEAIDWFRAGRSPTPAERRQTLELARRMAKISYLPWVAAAAFYATVDGLQGHTARHLVKLVLGTLDGGVVSVTLGFFVVERALRPILAAALAGGEPPDATMPGVRLRLVLTWCLGSGVPLLSLFSLPWYTRGATERTDIGPAVVTLAAAALVVGAVITVALAKSLSEPIEDVRRALDEVRGGRLDVEVAVDRGGDLGLLQAGVNNMVQGLRERARLADLFGRHVGTEVARRALQDGTDFDSEQRVASVLFVDIIGSTAMAEVLAPAEVMATVNAFFEAVVRVVTEESGWVNKFEGDGALCVWGAPADDPENATRALRAARRLRDELRLVGAAHPGLDAAIGVSAGSVVAGNVGTEARYEYTVLGGPVNEAARLTDLAKERDGRVLASAAVLARALDGEQQRWAGRGTVALRGRRQPTEVYEPVRARKPSRVS